MFRFIKPMTKVAINMKPLLSPWGGGNQFVGQFCSYLKANGYSLTYRLEPDISCIIMVKSWPTETTTFDVTQISKFKQKYPNIPCIHRINECDLHRGTHHIDEGLRKANEIADFTVFISHWLKDYFAQRWFSKERQYEIIYNGADANIFYPNRNSGYVVEDEFRIVTHHWSDNWMKGFKVYREVDQMIAEGELKGFSFTIIGRWPKEIRWKSAKAFPPTKGKKLAELLRKSHIYLTASLWEGGGMHHIEGAQCGLPLVYHEDGGGIVECGKRYGIGFRGDVKTALLLARKRYSELRSKLIEFMPSGLKMCKEYESVVKSLVCKKNGE